MKGQIIVFEGIDGSGKKTQSEKLYEFLISAGVKTKLLSFPFYQETFFGKEVANYLNGAFGKLTEVHPKLAAILYAGDRYEKKKHIINELKQGTLLICDRYVPSNIAHHAAKLPISEQLVFKEWVEYLEYSVFKIPQPSIIILLEMPPHVSKGLVLNKQRRDYTSKKQDLHEENQEYLKKVYQVFNLLSQNKNWIKIKCYEDNFPKPIEEIHRNILQKITNFLDITLHSETKIVEK